MAESTGLLNLRWSNPTEGSNPSLSAIYCFNSPTAPSRHACDGPPFQGLGWSPCQVLGRCPRLGWDCAVGAAARPVSPDALASGCAQERLPRGKEGRIVGRLSGVCDSAPGASSEVRA